jgi:hypothetical protein
MDERLRLVDEENRPHLASLLQDGDPAVLEALTAYEAHVQWAREVHKAGWMSSEEIPTFARADAGRQILTQAPRRLIALAAALMADKAAHMRAAPRFAPLTHIDHLTERLLDRLATRKLPYTPSDAAVIIDLATAYPWLEELRVAISAAQLALDSDDAPAVIQALRRLDAVFVEEPKSLLVSKAMGYHPKVRALLANREGKPSGAVGTDDAFGPAAAKLLGDRHTGWDSAEALAFLMAARGTRPSKAWWRDAEERAATKEDFGRLVVDLLDLVASVELTDGSDEVHGVYHSDVLLLGEVNTIVVRGAAWSARFVDRLQVADALSRAALRCSSLVRGMWGIEPMNSKVAYAAVASLVAMDTVSSRTELERLVSEVQAVPVLRRIAEHLELSEPEIKALIKDRKPHRLVHRTDRNG